MYLNIDGEKVQMPDYLIVGTSRSGTTSLYLHLSKYPEIFLPKVKEPFFFCFSEKDPKELYSDCVDGVIWTFDEYKSLFKDAKPGQVIGEASSTYLYTYKHSIPNIKRLYGEKYKDLKIIIILRNPIDRAFSQYTFLIRNDHEHLPFEEAIEDDVVSSRLKLRWGFDYLNYGLYYEQVKAFIDEFDNVKVYLFEDLKDIDAVLSDFFDFVGVNAQLKKDHSIKANPSGIPKSRFLTNLFVKESRFKNFLKRYLPQSINNQLLSIKHSLMRYLLKKNELDPKTRQQLIPYFRDDILKLEELIGRDLSSWVS